MKRKIKESLFTKIFIITYLLIGLCCFATYIIISWVLPKTYSTSLDSTLNNEVTAFISKIGTVTPLESGRYFDEFLLNHSDVFIQLYDSEGNEIEVPSQSSTKFPFLSSGGMAAENSDPAAYRARHTYLISFSGVSENYTLVVAGSAAEVHMLKDTLGAVFLILALIIFLLL